MREREQPCRAATNATLVLTNVQLAQSGNHYSVQVSNSAGATNSSSALLTVNTLCTPPPLGLVSWWAAEGNANDSFATNNGILVNGVGFAPGESWTSFQLQWHHAICDESGSGSDQCSGFLHYGVLGQSQCRPCGHNRGKFWHQRYCQSALCDFPLPSADWISFRGRGEPRWGTQREWLAFLNTPTTICLLLLVYDAPITGWTHIAVVYLNQQPSLYVNGVLVRTGVTSSTHSCPGTCLGEAATGYGYYSGLLDEVSIYNRPLSAAEVQAIYNAGSSGKCANPPIIAGQPQGRTVFAGSTVNFGVNAVGSQPLAYQWFVNASNLPAATNATLVLTNVQPANAGNYSVHVSNLIGGTNSSNATLTVIPSGSCFPPPSGLVDWWAGEGNALDSFGTNNGRLVNGVGFAPR